MKVTKLLTIIISAFILLTGCSKKNDNSAMFRGGLERTGVYQTKSVEKLSALKWKFRTEGIVTSSPTIADGIVYFGGWDNILYAVDIKTGQEKWRFKTEDCVFSSPAVADGIVYFGSWDKNLYAVE